MSHVALLKTDLSRVHLVSESSESVWTAPEVAEDERGSVRPYRLRTMDAASWVSSQSEIRRRLGAAILDVDDALLAWVKAPSDARPVLAVALRNLMQEWGGEHLADSVEPLVHRERTGGGVASRSPLMRRLRALGKSGDEENGDEQAGELPGFEHQGAALAVIAVPDALTRLWLDALDRRSVKVARVMTLWHALGIAWNDPSAPGVSAVLLIDDERLVWSWVQGHDLLAGGSVELGRAHTETDEDGAAGAPEAHRPAACTRLALDWLTWASQLGTTPDRVVIVGNECGAWGEALAGQWTDIEMERIEQPLAIARTLEAVAGSAVETIPERAPRCLEGLTHRPTRALRGRYRLAGAAMLLLLVAVSSVAFRLSQKAEDWRADANQIRDDANGAVRAAFPALASGRIRDPERAAEMQVQNWLGEDEIVMPPQPRQVLLELVRITEILCKPQGDDPEAELRVLEIELDQDRNNELRYAVTDRQLAAELLQQLAQDPGRFADWKRRPRDPDPLRPTLTGDWILK